MAEIFADPGSGGIFLGLGAKSMGSIDRFPEAGFLLTTSFHKRLFNFDLLHII